MLLLQWNNFIVASTSGGLKLFATAPGPYSVGLLRGLSLVGITRNTNSPTLLKGFLHWFSRDPHYRRSVHNALMFSTLEFICNHENCQS